VSIGSSSRNHKAEAVMLGEKYVMERIGTDGSVEKAIELIKKLDGKVDAMGLGGIDLYLAGANKKFMIKEAVPIVKAAKKTPIVDGTGLKNTLEKSVIQYLYNRQVIDFTNKKVLIVCAIDRYKMAEEFVNIGCETVLGDLIFALGIPIPIKSLTLFKSVVAVLLPVVSMLPYEALYPTGSSQDEEKKDKKNKKFEKFYNDADIIAGDFLFIKKYIPDRLTGKIIITNTVTRDDIEMLKGKGVSVLITSTPEFDGRSFGTNMMEAVLVAASGKKPEQLSEKDYIELIEKLKFYPRIEHLEETYNSII
jgi:hypothetical protein